jgi:hypothetical protein
MSGGGYLIALDSGLYRRAAAALVELGAIQATAALGGGVVQLAVDDGHLFTLYELVPAATAWEVAEGRLTAAQGVQLPDFALVVACPFECRWPDLVARIADALARTAEAPTWVLDGDGVLWDAKAVDPLKVRL